MNRSYLIKRLGSIALLLLVFACAAPKVREQAPEIPVFRYEQYVHNEGMRGKFAFESHDVVTLTPDRKKTDGTFKFTGAVLGTLMGEQRNIQITRLDRDLTWQINMNKKRYLEYPIKKTAFQVGVIADDPSGETAYVEDCCSVKTALKRTGTKKVVNGYDAEQVVLTMSSACQPEPGQQAAKTIITLEVWIAPKVPAADLAVFDRAYAQKVGIDTRMFQAMGDQMLKIFPGIKDLALMMNDLKGYPILSTLTVEDANYLQRQQEERKKKDREKGESSSGSSPKDMVSGFFSKKMAEREEKKQQEEDLKWGNVIWRVSWESRNFQNMKITADEFELPEGLKKVEQKENLEGEQGKAVVEAKPAHFVKTACLSTLTKAQIGTAIYPGAKEAHQRPYNEADRNTQWYYLNKNNYRIQYATPDSLEKVKSFYEKEFKTKCPVTTKEEGGSSYKEATCSQSAGPGVVRTFKMSEKPLEMQLDTGMADPSAAPPQKLLGFELSAGKAK